jgi:hypothetical protein
MAVFEKHDWLLGTAKTLFLLKLLHAANGVLEIATGRVAHEKHH